MSPSPPPGMRTALEIAPVRQSDGEVPWRAFTAATSRTGTCAARCNAAHEHAQGEYLTLLDRLGGGGSDQECAGALRDNDGKRSEAITAQQVTQKAGIRATAHETSS